MCPICVASANGGYFLGVFTDRPGKGGKKPFLRAVSRVEMAGENNAACAKATRSAGVALLFMAAVAMAGDAWGSFGSVVVHKACVVGSRLARRTSLSLNVTVHDFALNVAVHPASHSCAMDSSDVLPRSGKV